LRRLGIEQRASALKAAGPPENAAIIDAALQRLTDEEGTGMGRLIKVMALSSPNISALPGFEP
jgi:SAM-dependent MidA family methyltransferase